MEETTGWTEGKPWEIAALGRSGDRVDGGETVRIAWGEPGFSGQIPSTRFSRKIVRPRLFKWFAIVSQWDMHIFVGRERH